MRHSMPLRHTTPSGLVAAALGGALLVGSPLLLGAPLLAADLDGGGFIDPPQVMPQQTVSFGSGWYVRGDIGVTDNMAISPSAPNLNTRDPAAIPTAPNLTVKQSTNLGYVASLGGGYQVNRWFRAEAMFDYHQPLSASYGGAATKCPGDYITLPNGTYRQGLEGCQPHYAGTLSRYDVLVNGYIDLGTYWIVTPYVGAGVGMAFGHYSTAATYTQTDGTPYDIYVTNPSTGTTLHGDFDASTSGNYYNLAYAFMAGLAFDVYDHTKIDIGYRYLNMGSIKAANSGTMSENELRVGVRYMIDN